MSFMVAVALLAVARAAERPDLEGRVVNEQGRPVAKATVFVYTAGPKTGTASVCPSCYPDCGKKAQTDAGGRFKINSLDPNLLFRLLVVSRGHESKFVKRVDPGFEPLEIALLPVDPVTDSKLRVAGMVIDPEGRAVVGAVLNIEGTERGGSQRWGVSDQDVDPVAVTDEAGQFVLRAREGVTKVHGLIEARGLAKQWLHLTPGRDHLIRLAVGTTVRGRVLRDDQPLTAVVVSLMSNDQGMGQDFHDLDAFTDAEGRFAILNVPAGVNYHFFGKIDSLRGQGILERRTVRSGTNGAIIELGDVATKPGFRVAGRILLADKTTPPPGTRLTLCRDNAWDYSESVLDDEGAFRFTDVPAGTVSLSLRLTGYRFAKSNPSLDWLNGRILGRVDSNVEKLDLLMEPGPRIDNRRDDDAPKDPADQFPKDKPLRGINP